MGGGYEKATVLQNKGHGLFTTVEFSKQKS